MLALRLGSQRLTLRDVAKHLAEAGLHAEAVASVLLHLLQQPPQTWESLVFRPAATSRATL